MFIVLMGVTFICVCLFVCWLFCLSVLLFLVLRSPSLCAMHKISTLPRSPISVNVSALPQDIDGYMDPKQVDTVAKGTEKKSAELDTRPLAGGNSDATRAANPYANFEELKRRSMAMRDTLGKIRGACNIR